MALRAKMQELPGLNPLCVGVLKGGGGGCKPINTLQRQQLMEIINRDELQVNKFKVHMSVNRWHKRESLQELQGLKSL